MRLLLISNSTNFGENYLAWATTQIELFCAQNHINKDSRIIFVPFAGVNIGGMVYPESYDAYESKVRNVFRTKFGLENFTSVHHFDDKLKAVREADCIVVGGGNTFHLVAEMHRYGLMDAIPNDMPIVQPASFKCLNLVPFQINPHYLDPHPEIDKMIKHGGETRQDRINEYLAVNQEMTVVGLREASALWVNDDKMLLKGGKKMIVMRYGKESVEIDLRCVVPVGRTERLRYRYTRFSAYVISRLQPKKSMGRKARYDMPSRKRLAVFEDHKTTFKVDGFPSTFFALYEVTRGILAKDVGEGLLDARQGGVQGVAHEVGQVVDSTLQDGIVAVGGDLAVDPIEFGLVVAQIVQRDAFLVEEEEEIQSLAEGGHLHLGVVAVGEEQVAAFGDVEPADFVRPSVFQHDVYEHLVESRVLQFVIVIVGGRPDLFQQAFLFCVEDVGLEADDAVLQRVELPQRGEGLAVDFQDEVIVVVVSLHVAEFEEESGFVDFQSVDVQIIEKYLFREESAIHLWEVGVDQVELLIREGGLDVVEGLTEGGLFCTEVAQHHGQVEQLTVVGFQQPLRCGMDTRWALMPFVAANFMSRERMRAVMSNDSLGLRLLSAKERD